MYLLFPSSDPTYCANLLLKTTAQTYCSNLLLKPTAAQSPHYTVHDFGDNLRGIKRHAFRAEGEYSRFSLDGASRLVQAANAFLVGENPACSALELVGVRASMAI